jgi:hypothetical protein
MKHWIMAFAIALGALAPLASQGGAAHACSCVATPTPTDLQFVDTVFAGTVTKVGEWQPGTSSGTPITVEVDVDHVWLGDVDAKTQVQTAAHGASCGYSFEVGVRYLIYANSGEVNICSPTQAYSESAVQLLEGVTGPGTPVEQPAPTSTDDGGGVWSGRNLVILLIVSIGVAAVSGVAVRRRIR